MTVPTIDFTWLFLKMMAVFVVMCVAALVVVKYVVPRSRFYQRVVKGQIIHILSRVHLGGRRELFVVRIGARHLLLGAGEGGVRCLAELEGRDVAAVEPRE
ncbi:MAG: flagellar biosynthetic protein FliO [Deltaproteobacteria bacterium]|nr:flagellar biosynthetic protein FliO [Deltaproteobacteria bacterium]